MWYIIFNGQQTGPLSESELHNYGLSPDSMVWKSGMPDWQRASTIPELAEALAACRANENSPKYGAGASRGAQQSGQYRGQYPPCEPNGNYMQQSDKSKVVTGILALLLGGIGIQYFYLGKIGGGFLTILLSLVTCGTWELITFIQGILILCMSDQDFERKYVFSNSTMPLF